MLVALVAKSVQVPLHTWIPEAMAAPTPVSALLHAACYVKAGVYLAARMHSFGAWPTTALGQWSLVWVGTVTMAVGVMYAMVQTDLKRMLAFSTVSQIGYMMMGIGIGTPLAIAAGLLHCLNHGFFKGGLFLTAGSVQHAAGTRDMNKLGGLAQKMPQHHIVVADRRGQHDGHSADERLRQQVDALRGGVAGRMGGARHGRVGSQPGHGFPWRQGHQRRLPRARDRRRPKDAHESPPTMLWGMGLLAAGSVILGVAPQLAVNYLLNPISGRAAMGIGVQVTWFGLSAGCRQLLDHGRPGAGCGFAGCWRRNLRSSPTPRVQQQWLPRVAAVRHGAGGGIFTGGEPLVDQGRLTAGDFSEHFHAELA